MHVKTFNVYVYAFIIYDLSCIAFICYNIDSGQVP